MMTSSNGNISALLAICVGNSSVLREFPAQRPVTRSFDVFFDMRPNKRLSKHWWGWWFETPSRPLWRHFNVVLTHWHDWGLQEFALFAGISFTNGLILILEWMSNYIRYKRIEKITCTFPNGATIEAWERIKKFIISPHTSMGMWLLIHAGIEINPWAPGNILTWSFPKNTEFIFHLHCLYSLGSNCQHFMTTGGNYLAPNTELTFITSLTNAKMLFRL